MNILLVEDDLIAALSLQMTLQALGHTVIGPVDRRDDALILSHRTRPDVAFLDIHLKRKADGIEIAGLLQRDLALPCWFITGHPDLAHANRNLVLGYVIKPYSARQILECLEVTESVRNGSVPATAPNGAECFADTVQRLAAMHRAA